jgi:spore cortex formation protein SpoVR/YcgB (stage V sporulation)
MWQRHPRICEDPTTRTAAGSPTSPAATGCETFDFAMRNFKDESFIAQFLSPKVMRDFRLFAVSTTFQGIPLADSYREVMKHLHRLWGFNVRLESIDEQGRVEMLHETGAAGAS